MSTSQNPAIQNPVEALLPHQLFQKVFIETFIACKAFSMPFDGFDVAGAYQAALDALNIRPQAGSIPALCRQNRLKIQDLTNINPTKFQQLVEKALHKSK